MITYLQGTVKLKTDKYFLLLVNNIGYQVFSSETLLAGLIIDQEMTVYTHQYVKEDALDLYGFGTLAELEFFQHLINISGVGPKSALAVLSLAKLDDIKKAIYRGDPTLLKKVSGIGQKTAERIVVELKNKITALATDSGSLTDANGANEELISALEALGYNMTQIRPALQHLPTDLPDIAHQVKAALKIINNK
ncbi:MAG: Holliday junction branch migration protein RuvA [Candidatus Komeilibacteria bacterium]